MSQLRLYQPDDLLDLSAIYQNSVRVLATDFYSTREIDAWAARGELTDKLKIALQSGNVWLALDTNGETGQQEIAAFGQLAPVDRIAFLYTAGRYARRGHAQNIYDKLEFLARANRVTELRTEASRVSKAFFLKNGFQVVEPEVVILDGEQLERFIMLKSLS